MNKIIGKILYFLGVKKTFKLESTEYENNLLSNAFKKVFTPTINCINELAEGETYNITLEYENINSNKMERENFELLIFNDNLKGLRFKIILPSMLEIGGIKYKESYGLSNVLNITQGEKKFVVSANSVTEFKTEFLKLPQILEGRFLRFTSQDDQDKECYCRLVIPVKNTEMIYPTSILEYGKNHLKFDIPTWDRQSSPIGIHFFSTKGMYVDLKIKGYHFHLYALEPMNYYIIDSINKIAKDEFINITKIIRTGLSFLSGKFYRDEVIYLTSNDSNFESIINFDIQVEENSIISDNQIINPHLFFSNYSKESAEIKEHWKDYHKMFSNDLFSFFCEKLIEVPEILRSIELIVNAGYISDPIQKGALYSVAIETITEYLKDKNEETFKPIPDKKKSQKFLGDLISELNKLKNDISEDGYNILVKKIEAINSPTNRDKLEKSFKLVGIALTSYELGVLDNRNKYLHGKKPIDSNEKIELEKISLELHSLIGRLILKYINYNGHYIHLPSWYLLKNSDFIEEIKNLDFEELKKAIEKIPNESFQNAEEFYNAKMIWERYKKFVKIWPEIEKLILMI